MLLVDAGNALFKAPGAVDEPSKKKAEFLLSKMGALGTFAMAPGVRDLNAGAAFLKQAAQKANVKVLSANLTDSSGTPLFPGSAVVVVGGVRVGLIGISPPGTHPGLPGLKGAALVDSVREEAKKLSGKVDLTVVLAAVPSADAYQLANAAAGLFDLILLSHEARGAAPAQRFEHCYLVPGGERGRALGKLSLSLSGQGNFVDLQELERSKQMIGVLDQRLEVLRQRLAAAKDEAAQKALRMDLALMQESKKSQQKLIAASSRKGPRTLKLDWITLGPEVKGDPALEKEVARIEPTVAKLPASTLPAKPLGH